MQKSNTTSLLAGIIICIGSSLIQPALQSSNQPQASTGNTVVDETYNEEQLRYKEFSQRYNKPITRNTRSFKSFEATIPTEDNRSSLEIQHISRIENFKRALLNAWPRWDGERVATEPSVETFATVEIRQGKVTIAPKPGYFGVITQQETKFGVQGARFDQVGTELAQETDITQIYEFTFHRVEHCIKTGRPTYSGPVGTITLKAKPARKYNDDVIELTQEVTINNTKDSLDIAFPTRKACRLQLKEKMRTTNNTPEKELLPSTDELVKCLRTPLRMQTLPPANNPLAPSSDR